MADNKHLQRCLYIRLKTEKLWKPGEMRMTQDAIPLQFSRQSPSVDNP